MIVRISENPYQFIDLIQSSLNDNDKLDVYNDLNLSLQKLQEANKYSE